MAKKKLRYMDFQTLVMTNKLVVSLTKEPHEYNKEGERKLKELAKEVESIKNDDNFGETVSQKMSFLMYKIATGQHFHEGNKRTALVAGSAFLQMNGYSIDIKDDGLVSVIDKAGVAAAGLSDVRSVVGRLIKSVP